MSTNEQWGLIICVIWPVSCYLMLALINYVDSKRGIKTKSIDWMDWYETGYELYLERTAYTTEEYNNLVAEHEAEEPKEGRCYYNKAPESIE